MALTSSISLRVQAKQTGSSDLGIAAGTLDWPLSIDLANGTGANQANAMWSDRRTLTTGANEDLDMAGVLVSELGATLTFTRVKAVFIRSLPANTTTLTVSRPASNGLAIFAAAGDAITIKPGGIFAYVDPSAAGIAVVAGTGDLLNIANAAGASATYEIVIIGTV